MLSLSCALLLPSLRRDDDKGTTTPVRVTGVDVCGEAPGQACENARRLADAELLDKVDDVAENVSWMNIICAKNSFSELVGSKD